MNQYGRLADLIRNIASPKLMFARMARLFGLGCYF